ncbi:GNAT family N-acetyltransferase [Halorientalis pallida]|uniref:GNAT family N-acetyltransferase n=1 Tax=Halorientalis pallida TaxID=2479928 RepID=UPI003C6F0769
MTDLTVREYQPEDQRAVRSLHERAMIDAGTYDPTVEDADLDDIEGTYLDVDGTFLVGVCDEQVIAMGALRPVDEWYAAQFESVRDPAGVVTRMRVDPPHQRQGYGQRLLDGLIRRARNLGYRELLLDTDPDQTAARAFYEANGFQREGTVDVEGFDDLTLVLYRTRLD